MGYTVKFGEGNFSFLLTTLLSMVQAEAFLNLQISAFQQH